MREQCVPGLRFPPLQNTKDLGTRPRMRVCARLCVCVHVVISSITLTWVNVSTPLDMLQVGIESHWKSAASLKNVIVGVGNPSATHVKDTTDMLSRQPFDGTKLTTLGGPDECGKEEKKEEEEKMYSHKAVSCT